MPPVVTVSASKKQLHGIIWSYKRCVKTRTLWAPLGVKFIGRFEVEVPGNYVETALCSSPSAAHCCKVHCSISRHLLVLNVKLINSVLGPFTCQPGRHTAMTLDTQWGAFWLKKENSRDGSEKETLPEGAVASVGDFEECGSQQRCFWTTDTEPHAQSCLCAEQFKSSQKGSFFFFFLSCSKWLEIKTLLLSELKERHWFFRSLTGRRIRCSLSGC